MTVAILNKKAIDAYHQYRGVRLHTIIEGTCEKITGSDIIKFHFKYLGVDGWFYNVSPFLNSVIFLQLSDKEIALLKRLLCT